MNSLQSSAFNLAPPPTLQWQPVQIANFTAVAGRAYPCNTTSAAFTVTLPASPSAGDQITLTDYAGTWGTNALTVNPNGGKISGSTSNIILSTDRNSVQLVYVDSTQGWLIYSGWNPATILVEYLVVAGGGGGGSNDGTSGRTAGGGGAGGYKTGTGLKIIAGTNYTVTVGAGGAGGVGGSANGNNGQNSIFSTVTSTGGGGGGGSRGVAGSNGGSGGGGGDNSGAAGLGVSGQGNNGSTGGGVGTAGGGGGSGGAGTTSGGGAGTSNSITGSAVTYAAGGKAGQNAGGGSGANNTGDGGKGSTSSPDQGFAGGSGIVIIAYPSTYPAASTTGSPTVTTSGGNRIYTFTGNGSITL